MEKLQNYGKEYVELTNAVKAIKCAILQSQQRALTAINQEQLSLYFGIGRFVSINTRNKNWGKGFIEVISRQIRKELPGLRGFSSTNLKNMRTFYEEWKFLENDNSSVRTDEFGNDSVTTPTGLANKTPSHRDAETPSL